LETRKFRGSGVDIALPLLGGNVFGWTIDRQASINVLVKAEAETVAGPGTEPQITWPRNSVGEYTTIAALMSEATETDRQRCAITLAIQAYV
jgi:hypothetical protein